MTLPSTAHGFTLLELLIVLALIGIMAAMVAPGLQRTYTAISTSGERAEAIRQLERLPLFARDAGKGIQIDVGDKAGMQAVLALPAAWVIEPVDPVIVNANGLCRGARLHALAPGVDEQWRLLPPACTVRDGF